MKSTAKAQAQARELKEVLEFRFKGSSTIDTVRQFNDADGFPVLMCSDGGVETAGNPVIAVRIKQVDAVSKDIFGNTNLAYTPHTIEVAYELDGTEAEPSRQDLAKLFVEVNKIGMKVLIKEVADATAVSEASLNATAVALALEYDVRHPAKGL